MEPFVEHLAKNDEIVTFDLGSARSVLMALNTGQIDVGIIGRTAKKSEFTGLKKRIGEGYTLVTNRKQMILNDELSQIDIHTALPEKVVMKNFPYLKHLIYHEKMADSLMDGEVRLISWDDWNDSFELLIPVDEAYNKNPDFRVPHLFSNDKLKLKKINEMMIHDE